MATEKHTGVITRNSGYLNNNWSLSTEAGFEIINPWRMDSLIHIIGINIQKIFDVKILRRVINLNC
jgi:hypothetical protein